MNHSDRNTRIFLAGLLCLIALQLNAQDGEPFMNHIKLDQIPGNKITAICKDLENTMVFAANTGIITFDSEEWQTIPVPNIPMAVSADSVLPLIYVGGRGFYGYLLKSEDGQYHYYPLGEKEEDPGDIKRIYQTTRDVIYYGEEMIAIADRSELYNITYYRSDSLNLFSGLIIYRDKAYVNFLGAGIFELVDNRFVKTELQNDFSSSEILFGLNYAGSQALFGLDDNRIFSFDGRIFTQVSLEDQEYLNESYLENAVWLSDHRFALSTILGGCMIVDISNGKTQNILNYRTGLPDDEIYAIGIDPNKGIWLSHQYGLTRVDAGLPIISFENYTGLSGSLTTVAILDSVPYIGTHNAVYFLEEIKEYLEEEIIVPIRTSIPEEPVPEKPDEPVTEEITGEPAAEEVLSAKELRIQKRQARKEARRQKKEAVPEETKTADATEPGDSQAEEKSKGLKSIFERREGKEETEEIQPIEAQTEEVKTRARPRTRIRFVK